MEITVEQLAKKVLETRLAQKNYFKAARAGLISVKQKALEHSKALEKDLDETVEGILDKSRAKQTNLF